MGAVVNPPKENEPSYPLFIKVIIIFGIFKWQKLYSFIQQEKTAVLDGLKQKAKLVTDLFNSIEGIQCNPVQGAMYAFPRIMIPDRAVEHAKVSFFK